MSQLLLIPYAIVLIGMALYGLLGLITLFYYWKSRHKKYPTPAIDPDQLPPVTIQLPIYNERYVIDRVVQATLALDYPQDKLQIQIVDDSTDDTTIQAHHLVETAQSVGFNISLIHRTHQDGYKAGALKNALASATGDFIAVFDADFVPNPDFLQKSVPHFVGNQRLGVVQTRWDHLNREESLLTQVQAMGLDKHFAMDQRVGFYADLFPKFNGSGGILRRACIDDVGGWNCDTVTEDLDLSTRAVLRGWECLFLQEITAPAELPITVSAFKNQQSRWAKGSIQCLLKFSKQILMARNQRPIARLSALLYMMGYLAGPSLVLALLLQIPLILSHVTYPPIFIIFSLLALTQPLLYMLAQLVLHEDGVRRLRYFPGLFIIGVGLTPSLTRAIAQVFWSKSHPFVRTPKGSGQWSRYRNRFDWIILAEILLGLYALIGIGCALVERDFSSLFLLVTCVIGFFYTAFLGVKEVVVAGQLSSSMDVSGRV